MQLAPINLLQVLKINVIGEGELAPLAVKGFVLCGDHRRCSLGEGEDRHNNRKEDEKGELKTCSDTRNLPELFGRVSADFRDQCVEVPGRSKSA